MRVYLSNNYKIIPYKNSRPVSLYIIEIFASLHRSKCQRPLCIRNFWEDEACSFCSVRNLKIACKKPLCQYINVSDSDELL